MLSCRPPVATACRKLTGLAVISVGVIGAVYTLFILTEMGQGIDDSESLARMVEQKVLRVFDKRLLEKIDTRVFAAGGLIVLALGVIRGRWTTGLLLSGSYVGAILSAEILKGVLPRPILAAEMETLMGDKAGLNTLPSGHTTFITAFGLCVIFLAGQRIKPFVAMGALVMVMAVTGAIVTSGWHRPSDVVAGVALGVAWIAIASAFSLWRHGETVSRSTSAWAVPLVGAGLAFALMCLLALLVRDPLGDMQLAVGYLATRALILAWVVATFSFFAGAVSGVDVRRD
jgi:membrane-associated phospholipid phosphatase